MCGNRAVHRTPNFLEKLDIQMSISTRPKKKKKTRLRPQERHHTPRKPTEQLNGYFQSLRGCAKVLAGTLTLRS